MEKYKYIPHTSDEQFKAFGTSLEEVFEHAAYAMYDIITDHTKIEENIEINFTIESENKEALLYDFLEEFLYYLDSEGFLLRKIKKLNITNNKLTVRCVGDNEYNKYEITTHIKAVTYQNMFVKKEGNIYSVQVVIDV